MANFEIITDSSASFYQGFLKEYSVKVLEIVIDENGYHPVSPKDASEAMEKILDNKTDVLYIGMSSTLSKSFQNITYIAKGLRIKYPDRKVEFIDSLSTGCALGLTVYYAAKLREQGKSIDEVVSIIESNKVKCRGLFILEDPAECEFLGYNNYQTSGVDIRPIFELDGNGKLNVLSKIIGRKKSVIEMVKYVKNTYDKERNDFFVVEYAQQAIEAEEFKNKLLEEIPGIEVRVKKANDFISHQLQSSGIGIAYIEK